MLMMVLHACVVRHELLLTERIWHSCSLLLLLMMLVRLHLVHGLVVLHIHHNIRVVVNTKCELSVVVWLRRLVRGLMLWEREGLLLLWGRR